ncbi:thioesterase family protein [Mangrovivirga sp. M17]|uniref:Thioesterase family protein n=1 Tax=Mangrovivirga halotolerans TaxID=2993936 RepID=A0ABT3RWQ3_9BACT|nr:thioesterase family protein [Mangrovivirga halotolerans]MCX2746055.1 thioesterase family protein [Mangrovivirga halotolerans]
MKEYTQDIKVLPGHIDELGHVNNIIYLKWVQETAKSHWETVASKTMQEEYLWVVLRHEIDYKLEIFADDIVRTKTKVLNMKGPLSKRSVEIYSNNKLAAKAITTWCLLNKTTRKPMQIPEEFAQLFL